MANERNKADWGNYWQGRTAGEVADALVGGEGVGIEHSTELAGFWENTFAKASTDISVLDLACGAGSVLRHAHQLGFSDLTGIDISENAIVAMQAAIAGATGIVGPVDQMPLNDDQYDFVVSQFGFEYAGSESDVLKAANEIVRVLKPAGKFVAICHIRDGGIDREVGRHLTAIQELEATGFIPASKDLFVTLFAAEFEPNEANQLALNMASQALIKPRETLVQWLASSNDGDAEIKHLGQHLFAGSADLFARRQAFALEDITGWLGGMQHEIDAYKGRMTSMKQAALDVQSCGAILNIFTHAGYVVSPPTPWYFSDEKEPAAWILNAGVAS